MKTDGPDDIDSLIRSFLRGYLNCRAQQAAAITTTPHGFLVDYAGWMGGRTSEYFVPFDNNVPSEVAAETWVTAFYPNGAEVPFERGRLQLGVTEFLMVTDLPGMWIARGGADIRQLGAADRAAYDAETGLPAAVDGPDVVQFAAFDGDRPVAGARYGIGDAGDIVIDRVETLPAFQRRGIGRQLLCALLSHAQEHGARRAVLISSIAGETLYAGLGFTKIAGVGVYGMPAD